MANADAVFTESRYVTPTGFGLYYRHYGVAHHNGPTPVVCLPGFWRNSRDYEDLAPYLAQRREVVAPDLRGRGQSDRTTDLADYRFDKLIDDVWGLLDSLRIERVAVIGTTLGGLMALEMACQRPDCVAGIVLNDVGPEKAEEASKRMAGHAGTQEFSFEDAIARVKSQNEAFFPTLGREDWIRLMKRAYRETETGNYTRDFDQLTNRETARLREERPTFWKEFQAIAAIPVAILRGEHSDYLTADVASRMVGAHPGAVLTTVSGRGHPPLLDEPQSIAAIDALLSKADGRN